MSVAPDDPIGGESGLRPEVLWRHDLPYRARTAVAITALLGAVAAATVVVAVVWDEPIVLAPAALFLACFVFALLSLRRPAWRARSVVLTADEVVVVSWSGGRDALARSDVVSVRWDEERRTGIQRRGHWHGEWPLPLPRARAQELAAALGVPFRG